MGADVSSPDERRRIPWSRTATISTVRSLYTIRPSPGPRWPLALQAALAIAAPIAVMTLLGRPDLGYQAATGAFAALHVSQLRARERATVLPLVVVGLIACAALGVLVGSSTVLTLVGMAVVTVGASAFMFGCRLGPPGPLFFVLTFGIAAHVAAVAPGFHPVTYLAAVSAGCVFSYLVALAPLVRPRRWREPRRRLHEILARQPWDADSWSLFQRSVLVAVIGSVAGILVDPDRAYWIVASGIAVVGVVASRRVAVSRGIHRMIGTVGGAGLYFLLVLVPWAGLWLAALLGALQFAIEIVVVRHYAMALVLITPMVLLLTGAATGDIGSSAVALERILDTIVGSVLGLVAIIVPPVRRTGPAAR
ncbi:hypothetical protein GCM10010460_22050 [Microbacterium terrae]|nr:hypothetical protein GCM10017594_25090 [Microbacterium terrae]